MCLEADCLEITAGNGGPADVGGSEAIPLPFAADQSILISIAGNGGSADLGGSHYLMTDVPASSLETYFFTRWAPWSPCPHFGAELRHIFAGRAPWLPSPPFVPNCGTFSMDGNHGWPPWPATPILCRIGGIFHQTGTMPASPPFRTELWHCFTSQGPWPASPRFTLSGTFSSDRHHGWSAPVSCLIVALFCRTGNVAGQPPFCAEL